MTPRGLQWATIAFDMACLAGIGVGLILALPFWLPYVAWKIHRQSREACLPITPKDRVSVSMEGHGGPRNDCEQEPPENHAA